MPKYKSRGEEAIAEILTQENIGFKYEHPTLVIETREEDGNKYRIWYPDFWLPKYSIIIEYFGMQGVSNYDDGIKRKKDTYKQLELDLISVYPDTIKKNLKAYLLINIDNFLKGKLRHFTNRHNPLQAS